MLSLVQELVRPKREIYHIKVLNVFAPSIFMVSFDDERMPRPTTSEYIELEHQIARIWHHAPAWNFNPQPDVGTFVMVMLKNKSNFKRGAILGVERIADTTFYVVFLYDWGLIKRVTIHNLAKLPGNMTERLPPRTFLVVLAGMLEINKNPKSAEFLQASADACTTECENDRGFSVSPNRGTKRARRWIEKREIFVDIFKNFEEVICTADVKGIKLRPEEGGTSRRECIASSLKKRGYLYMDDELRLLDKDPKLNNWDTLSARLNKVLQCIPAAEKVSGSSDSTPVASQLHF